MAIDTIWEELEKELATAKPGVWLSRFALPDPRNLVLVAIEGSSRKRALLLPLAAAAIPPRHEWPECRGLELFTIQIDDSSHFGIRLIDPQYSDVFAALAEDVAPRVAAAGDARGAGIALLERLRRWQKFLTARADSLSLARQRGLFGELHLLRRFLLPTFGAAFSVRSWRAPLAAHQDFQFPGGAIEVKTTTAKQPYAVRITSERQLDGTGTAALFLFVVVLDEREVEARDADHCETLPGAVTDVRQVLGVDGEWRETFDDRLLDSGYLEADAPRYEGRLYALRSEHCFHVVDGFPRLLEHQLPVGIGDISYALSLSSCSQFEVAVETMISAIQQNS